MKHIVDGAIEKNIPVVTFNSDIMQSRRLCFVGQDLIRAGKTAGSLMAKLLGGHGKVAIITGSLSLLALSQRIKGFREIIETEHPGIEIIDIIETKEQKTLTFEKTIHLLETVKDLNGIYVTSEPINEVGKAVKLLKKSGEIKIICFDFYPEVVKLVKEGIIDFTIGQDPVAQGYKPIKILFDYLFNGKQPQADHIKTTVDIREKENIDYIVE
ncbi:MAG: substrate-binding domain-containing protein [Acetivibrionales bacterium]